MIKVNHENKVWKIAKIAVSIVLVVMCAMTVVAAAYGATYNVTIIEDSSSVTITTSATTLSAVFKEAGVSYDSNDIVNTEDFVPGQPSTIILKRGYNISVTYHGETFKMVGFEDVKTVLKDAELEVSEKDTINFSLDNKLSDGMKIVIENPITVTVKVDGAVVTKETFSANVSQILSKCGIEMGKDDFSEPALNEIVKEDTTIVVKRVTYKERTEKEVAKYGTTYEDNAKAYKGNDYTKSKGKDGEKEVLYRDKYVDGVKVGSEAVSEKILKEPVNQVVVRGTKEPEPGRKVTVGKSKVVQTVSNFALPSKYKIDENLVPESYTKKFVGPGTAYHGGYRTSCGKIPEPGYIAVDPDVIPYGSKLWIVSNDGKYVYGYAIAADTGGFAWNGSGTLADLYFKSTPDCIQFGRRDITIYVLE